MVCEVFLVIFLLVRNCVHIIDDIEMCANSVNYESSKMFLFLGSLYHKFQVI